MIDTGLRRVPADALLPRYLPEIASGGMAMAGEPRVTSDHGSAFTWNGDYLPGPWLVRRAIDEARQRLALPEEMLPALAACARELQVEMPFSLA